MNKSIATEKEEILEKFDNLDRTHGHIAWDESIKPFLSQSLDHIASVARQEGREEAIEEIQSIMKKQNRVAGMPAVTTTTYEIFGEENWVKLTRKEEEKL